MTTTNIDPPLVAGRLAAALRWSPDTIRAKTVTFLGVCMFALLSALVLFQVPYRHTVYVGSPNDDQSVRGFYDAEGKGNFTYRWSEGRALVRLPLGVFPGEADIVLSGNRPGSKPPGVALGLPDKADPLAHIQSTGDFVTYPVRLPTDGAQGIHHPLRLDDRDRGIIPPMEHPRGKIRRECLAKHPLAASAAQLPGG